MAKFRKVTKKVDIKQEEYFFNHKKKTITILKGNVKWLNLEKLL